MMHLHGLTLFLCFLTIGGRRNMRIGNAHHDTQQQNNLLSHSLEVSGGAEETFIPGFRTGIDRRSEATQDGSVPLVAQRSRLGSRPAKAGDSAPVRTGVPQMISKAKIANKNVWVSFAKAKDVPPGTIESGFRYGQEIAIVNEKGQLYAVSNKVPPTGQPATFCSLSGDGTLREPISGTKFSIKTGKVVGPWCPSLIGNGIKLLVPETSLPVYPVRKFGDNIEVKLNINAKAQFEQNYWRGILDSQGKVDGGYY